MKTEKVLQEYIGLTYQEVLEKITTAGYHGDCCGYSDIEVSDFVEALESNEDSKLVDVVKISYDDEDEWDRDRVVVNFLFTVGGEKDIILGYDLYATSGTGWSYGAWCSLFFNGEKVATASW